MALNKARELRAQHRLLNSLEASFLGRLASEIARAQRQMLGVYEETGEVPSAPDHQRNLEALYKSMAIMSVSAFGARMANQGKDSGLSLELKDFAEDMVVAALDYLGKRSVQARIVNVSHTTRQQILDAVSQAYIQGLGQREAAKVIRERVPSMSTQRASVIARTETHGAANYGAYAATKKLGLDMRKEWMAAIDDRTRFDHMTANGQIVGADDPFVLTREDGSSYTLLYAGDPDGPADGVINCRCAIGWTTEPATGVRPAETPPAATVAQQFEDVWANKGHADRLLVKPAFKNTPPEMLDVVAAMPSIPNGVERGTGSHYDSGTGTLRMDSGLTGDAYMRVMRHEYGHFVDNQLYARQHSIDGKPVSVNGHAILGVSHKAYHDMYYDALDLVDANAGDHANVWVPKDEKMPETPGASEKARAKSAELRSAFRKLPMDERDAAIRAEFTKRGLTPEDVVRDFNNYFTVGPDAEINLYEHRVALADFLADFDTKNHNRMLAFYDFSNGHGKVGAGLSDSIGAVTNQRIGYYFGHPTDYYQAFMPAGLTFGDRTTMFQYGQGNSAQVFANWFEARMSGNKTQYSVFKQLFPRTSAKFEELVKEALNAPAR